MGLTAKDKGGRDFEPVEEGLHHAICYGVIDIGTQFNSKFGKWVHQCYITFELPEQRIKIDGRDMPRAISKKFTVSLHEKAELRKYLQTWRGKAFSQEELQGFDIKNLIGVNCFIQIIHSQKNDKTFANIAGIIPLPKGTVKRELENERVYFSFEDGMVNIPANTPGWIADQIKSAKEWGGEDGNQDPGPTDDVPF